MKKSIKLTFAALVALGVAQAYAALDGGGAVGAKDLFLLDDDSKPAAKPDAKAKPEPKTDAPKADAPKADTAKAEPAERPAKTQTASVDKPKTKPAPTQKPAPQPQQQQSAPPMPAQPAGGQQKYMGLAYWVDLNSDGQIQRAPTSRVFKSGERIKLNLKSNKDGYLYVVTLSPSGKTETVYPRGGAGENFVKAGQLVQIPSNEHSWLKFENQTGEEQILVMLASQPVPELAPGSPKANPELKQTSNMVAFAEKRGAKDLVIEDDFTPPSTSSTGAKAQQASYAVAPVASLNEGKTVNLVIKLKHQ